MTLLISASDTDQKQVASVEVNTPASLFNQTMLTTDNTKNSTPASIYNSLDIAIKRLAQPDFSDLTTLVSRLESIIISGKRAVCLGHSQGNFFCNLAYEIIQLDYDDNHTLKSLG